MASFVFWTTVALIVHHHVGYPILIRLLLAWRRPEVRAVPLADAAYHPSVTVIVPAHNEAAVIDAKIRNLAELDYPHGQLTVVLALDGCTDGTRAIVGATLTTVPPGRFTVAEYNPNIGKIAVLNDQIARARGDIVALTDASALVAPDAIVRGMAHFAEASVGVVTGRYSVAGLHGAGEAAYWRYQSDVRSRESALIGPVGAHGAFYLFRRSAWEALPADTINDDFVLPMTIVLRGFRAIFDPEIVATELERSGSRQEFRRRIRIGAGNLQQVVRLARLGDLRRGWPAIAFLSGKGLRGVLPFLLTAMIASSVALAIQGSNFFTVLSVVEAAAVGLAWFGGAVPGMRDGRMTGPLIYALEGYLALCVGAVFVLLRHERKVWRLSKNVEK